MDKHETLDDFDKPQRGQLEAQALTVRSTLHSLNSLDAQTSITFHLTTETRTLHLTMHG